MIDRDVVLDKVRSLLDSVQGRAGVQAAPVLERVVMGLEAARDDAEVTLHCSGLARALRGIESQGALTPEEFVITLELHEELEAA